MESLNEIFNSIQWAALIWVALMMFTSVLHKYGYHKLDKYLCLKCITFWVTLIFSHNVFIAALASLIAYLIDKHISNNNNQIIL